MTINYRAAQREDVPAIVALYADDALGRQREDNRQPLPQTYYAAFANIARNPDAQLIVAEQDGEIVGTYQLNIMQGLAIQGMVRATVEAVRIAAPLRGAGLGSKMMQDAMQRARHAGAAILQLTSHGSRADAHRFYEKLGFEKSHAGFKLKL
ncbi:GNAT family N-acetyltransferase [Methylovirgula sp. 4M-Z18]|uniref:GNAT family N-acetyltransferase n=1 Tax=Methylovirgula sp. 4M-Z18 TaxID=2293567 RepID=UPI000E2F0E24|nr:GNAT family N-acetyltransferase [Methylovirgula sp. 4M-Z18]RFB78831.1 GNAT family N-acetyltransferase [Methylovirgula sp. 4M-Z18]